MTLSFRLVGVTLLLIPVGGSHSPCVDVCEINSVTTGAGTTSFTQVILWRWQYAGLRGPDHYVSQWSMIDDWTAHRCGTRWQVAWRVRGGSWQRVSARTFRVTGPARADPEAIDRHRLHTEARSPYRLDRSRVVVPEGG